MKLNFCPFDFVNIDPRNLAYELIFSGDWTWESVQKETVVGSAIRTADNKLMSFIREQDETRGSHYKPISSSVRPVMFLGNEEKGGKCGLDLFETALAEYYKRMNQMTASGREEDGELSDFELYEKQFAQNKLSAQKALHRSPEPINGMPAYVDSSGNVVFYALPCCPKCHNRLPIGWSEAEDFGAVALMAPSGSGKTTLLCSMMGNEWASLKRLGNQGIFSGRRLRIQSAHFGWGTDTTYYQDMKKESEKMCRDGGECPDSTDKEHWIPPVFLNVSYGAHTMIVGLYDNAGETLSKMNFVGNDSLRKLLNHTFAEIFLFDPKYLNISLPSDKAEALKKRLADCHVLSLEEQKLYQSGNPQKELSAQEILETVDDADVPLEEELDTAMEVYDHQMDLFYDFQMTKRLHEMYFAGVIIKSDLLEQSPQIAGNPAYSPLFSRMVKDDYLNNDAMKARRTLAEKLIQELHLFGTLGLNEFRQDFGDEKGKRDAVSWHFVSALGCDTTKPSPGNPSKLKGKYAPIRVAEPLVTCILKRIVQNGWIE